MTLVHQGRLSAAIHHIFKGEKILHNVRKQAKIKNPFTGSYLELDLWVPRLHLCFEFQDIYHYTTSWYSQLPLSVVQQKDNTKQQIVQFKKITLVMVPFWWNGSYESLEHTIYFQRPDLFSKPPSRGLPIQLLPPMEHAEGGGIPSIGEPMLASFPSVLPDYSSWWMGEKYDGIRFCSIMKDRKLYTRNGVEIFLSTNITCLFPAAFFDGEIWLGRGYFTDTQKLLFTSPKMTDWSNVRFLCFDNAAPRFNSRHFEYRYESILHLIPLGHPFLMVVTRVSCSSTSHMVMMLQHVIDHGGEGLVLRSPKSRYEHGRSSSLVKLKAYRGDKEALLVDFENNIAILQLPNGSLFEVHSPTSSSQLHPGDVITFSYDNYTQGSLPINPKILRRREDLAWQDVLRDFDQEAVHTMDLNTTSRRAIGQASKFGTIDEEPKMNGDTVKRRKFFEDLAAARGFDPLVAVNWYPQVLRYEDEWSMLRPYKGRFPKALLHLFPEIGLNEQKFLHNTFYDYESNKESLRAPPATRSATSTSPLTKITTPSPHPPPSPHLLPPPPSTTRPRQGTKGGERRREGETHRRGYWATNDKANVRRFFDRFASDRQLDPLKASTWYNVSLSDISAAGGAGIKTTSGQSIYSSILATYPEIGDIAAALQKGHARTQSDKYLLYLCAQYEKQQQTSGS